MSNNRLYRILAQRHARMHQQKYCTDHYCYFSFFKLSVGVTEEKILKNYTMTIDPGGSPQ